MCVAKIMSSDCDSIRILTVDDHPLIEARIEKIKKTSR
jgi:hypothetical protein